MPSETPEERAKRKAKEAKVAAAGRASTPSASRSKAKDAAPKLPSALQFGPISQTVAIMLILCLLMGTVRLPQEMQPFYILFSRITGTAVIVIVGHASIVAYGYKQALAAIPPKKQDEKKEKIKWVYRPDDWAHTRSHPAHFLTTRNAAPRIFPFPLGKTRPAATVKDELWWEGGNAPHVGHFNRPKLPDPPAPPSKSVLKAKAKKQEQLAAQQRLWEKRLLNIKLLCGVVLISFINLKIAAVCLAALIYRVLNAEIDSILNPPKPVKADRPDNIDLVQRKPVPNAANLQPNMGMSYIYGPDGAGGLGQEAAIPITPGPAPVLMTTANGYYAN